MYRDVMGMKWPFLTTANMVTSRSRLGKFRARSNDLNKRHNKMPPTTWRDVRYERHWTPTQPTYRKDKWGDLRMFINHPTLGEDVGSAHDIIGHHSRNIALGYYVDGHYSETLTGHVMKLRCPKGTLYIPMTQCSGWDGVTYYLNDAYLIMKGLSEDSHEEAMREVAKTADRCAEIESEICREDWLKEEAKYRIEENKAEIKEIASAIRKRFQSLRHLHNQAMQDMIGECDEIKKLLKTNKKLEEVPWELLY